MDHESDRAPSGVNRRMSDWEGVEVRRSTPEEQAVVSARSKVEEHGEIGPLLVDASQHFTTARDAKRRSG